MLGEYLNEIAQQPPNKARGKAANAAIIAAFTSGAEFLSDPERFPNRLTNTIVGVMHRQLAHKDLGVIVMDKTPNPDSVSGIAAVPTGNPLSPYRAALLLSKDYHHLARRRPSSALATIANLAAGARILQTTIKENAYLPPNRFAESQVLSKIHASACTADTLHTLIMMAENEKIAFPIEAGAREAVETYPQGFAGLPAKTTHLRLNDGPGSMPIMTPFEIGFLADIEFVNLVNPREAAALVVSGALTRESYPAAKKPPSLATAQLALGAIDSSLHLHANPTHNLTTSTLPRRGKHQDACVANPREYQQNLDRLREHS